MRMHICVRTCAEREQKPTTLGVSVALRRGCPSASLSGVFSFLQGICSLLTVVSVDFLLFVTFVGTEHVGAAAATDP